MSFEMNKKRDLFKRVQTKTSQLTSKKEAEFIATVTDSAPISKTALPLEIQESLPLNNKEIYHSVPDVAKMFEVADATVYRWIYKGLLNGTIFGNKRKVATSEVKRFIASRNQPGTKLK